MKPTKEFLVFVRALRAEEAKTLRQLAQIRSTMQAAQNLVNGSGAGRVVRTRRGKPPERDRHRLRETLITILQKRKQPMTREQLVPILTQHHKAAIKRAGKHLPQIVAMCLHNSGDFKEVGKGRFALA